MLRTYWRSAMKSAWRNSADHCIPYSNRRCANTTSTLEAGAPSRDVPQHVFPTISEPYSKSGHAYRRETGIWNQPSSSPDGAKGEGQVEKHPSVDSETDVISTDEQAPPMFLVNNKQVKLAVRLFSKADRSGGQGQMRSDGIVNVNR